MKFEVESRPDGEGKHVRCYATSLPGWQFNRIFRPPNRPPKDGRLRVGDELGHDLGHDTEKKIDVSPYLTEVMFVQLCASLGPSLPLFQI